MTYMFYDKRTQRKIQLLNLLIALLILIPILLDFSKGFMMGLNSSVIGFQNGLEESTFQICTNLIIIQMRAMKESPVSITELMLSATGVVDAGR